jgi:hypothetical protein
MVRAVGMVGSVPIVAGAWGAPTGVAARCGGIVRGPIRADLEGPHCPSGLEGVASTGRPVVCAVRWMRLRAAVRACPRVSP